MAVKRRREAHWFRHHPAERPGEPPARMLALARGHVVYCRRDVGEVISSLRAEFADGEHPAAIAVGAALGKRTTSSPA